MLVKALLSKAWLDIFILQETKLDSIDRRLVKAVWSPKHVGWSMIEGSSGGVIDMWKQHTVQVIDSTLGYFFVSVLVNYKACF